MEEKQLRMGLEEESLVLCRYLWIAQPSIVHMEILFSFPLVLKIGVLCLISMLRK